MTWQVTSTIAPETPKDSEDEKQKKLCLEAQRDILHPFWRGAMCDLVTRAFKLNPTGMMAPWMYGLSSGVFNVILTPLWKKVDSEVSDPHARASCFMISSFLPWMCSFGLISLFQLRSHPMLPARAFRKVSPSLLDPSINSSITLPPACALVLPSLTFLYSSLSGDGYACHFLLKPHVLKEEEKK